MTLEAQFQAQRPMLWALAYRMTGLASEADDIVQETFLRAIERPPADTSRLWAPWLTRVAMNEGSLVVNSSQGGGSKDTWIVEGRL